MPFRLGDQVAWEVFTADPTAIPQGGLPRFVEAHDRYVASDVPRAELGGTVVAIAGMYYPHASSSGQDSTIPDTVRPFSRVLQTVDRPDEAEAGEFLVQLEIPEGTRLPGFVASAETVAHCRVTAELAGLDRARMGDTVSARLERLADEVQQRWGRLADIRRSSVSSVVTVIPHVVGGCVIGWSRQDEAGQDSLRIHAGEGVWVFPAGVRFVEVLGEFVAAAAAGRIEEQVQPSSGPSEQLRTVVYAENGYSWTATTPVELFGSGDSFAALGSLWQRAQRGNHDYPPWTTGA